MEFNLINRLKQKLPPESLIRTGIGDDCAVFENRPGWETLITTDTLLDGVHCLADHQTLQQIARKSLAVNLSDIAAMGGLPVAAFFNLTLPRNWSAEEAEKLFDHFREAAQNFQIPIAGGDTTSWAGPLAITITIYGEVEEGSAKLRSQAKSGDIICVSGPLGGSIFGRQFTFQPRITEARWLITNAKVHAMIDLSDGLISDIKHLLAASHVGAELDLDQIPISPDTSQHQDDKPAWLHAVSDGEDFELLWTMPQQELTSLLAFKDAPLKIYPIGRIVTGSDCRLLDKNGQPVPCNATGYVHDLD